MMRIRLLTRAQAIASLASLVTVSLACAALPAPTPAAQQAAAAKKAVADAEAEMRLTARATKSSRKSPCMARSPTCRSSGERFDCRISSIR